LQPGSKWADKEEVVGEKNHSLILIWISRPWKLLMAKPSCGTSQQTQPPTPKVILDFQDAIIVVITKLYRIVVQQLSMQHWINCFYWRMVIAKTSGQQWLWLCLKTCIQKKYMAKKGVKKHLSYTESLTCEKAIRMVLYIWIQADMCCLRKSRALELWVSWKWNILSPVYGRSIYCQKNDNWN
jgi:hypothetical protein